MGNAGTKMEEDTHGSTSDWFYHIWAPVVLVGNILMRIFTIFRTPPKRENPNVQKMRIQWQAQTDINAERLLIREEAEATSKRHNYQTDINAEGLQIMEEVEAIFKRRNYQTDISAEGLLIREEAEAISKRHKYQTDINAEGLPTREEAGAIFKRHNYQTDRLHFAICGPSGSGKSSLINSFRGLKAKDPGAAPVGIVETTTKTTRYPDPRPGMPYELFVWYDIPGAGTVDVPSIQYFNEQGLFIFDFIILVYDTRFTEIDAKILEACRKFDVPIFVVRSKANQHIRNMRDDDNELTYEDARDQYVLQTRQNFEKNLKKLDLYDEKSRCYIVSATNIYSLIKSAESGESRKNAKDIDEEQLLTDLVKAAFDRRYKEELSGEPQRSLSVRNRSEIVRRSSR